MGTCVCSLHGVRYFHISFHFFLQSSSFFISDLRAENDIWTSYCVCLLLWSLLSWNPGLPKCGTYIDACHLRQDSSVSSFVCLSICPSTQPRIHRSIYLARGPRLLMVTILKGGNLVGYYGSYESGCDSALVSSGVVDSCLDCRSDMLWYSKKVQIDMRSSDAYLVKQGLVPVFGCTTVTKVSTKKEPGKCLNLAGNEWILKIGNTRISESGEFTKKDQPAHQSSP